MSFMIDQILASSSSSSSLTSTNNSRRPLQSLTNTSQQKERRMWQCETCPKAFDRPSLLTRHVRTHTGKIKS